MNGAHGQCLAPREPWIRLTLMTRTRTVGIVVTADKDTEIPPAGVVFPGSAVAGSDPVIPSSTPSIPRCLEFSRQ